MSVLLAQVKKWCARDVKFVKSAGEEVIVIGERGRPHDFHWKHVMDSFQAKLVRLRRVYFLSASNLYLNLISCT
jgi:hypothetical protein